MDDIASDAIAAEEGVPEGSRASQVSRSFFHPPISDAPLSRRYHAGWALSSHRRDPTAVRNQAPQT